MTFNIAKKIKEKNLLYRLRQKDKDAFTKTYDEHVDDIHRFIYFKVGNNEDANDLTSIVFLKAWDYINQNSLKDSNTLRALFYKIARTSIADFYRSQKNGRNVSIDDENDPIEIVDASQDVIKEISTNSDLELIRKKLPELKMEYREVIIMHYVNDLSLEEISEITGKKKATIRVLIYRALKALRETMK